MPTRAQTLSALLIVLFHHCTLSAQTTYTFNQTTGSWSSALNWTSSGGGFPNATNAIARFDSGAVQTVDVDGTFDTLAVQFGTTQTNSVNLRAVGGVSGTHQINVTPGTGANGSIVANNGKTTLYAESGSAVTYTVGAGIKLSGGSAGVPVSHVWEIAGSRTVNVSGSISATLSSGNTLTKVGTGTLALSGNNAQANLWTGGLIINEGTVLANNASNSTGSGPVTVNNGATLGGRGQVFMGVSTFTTINPGGTLTAGTSAGAPQLQISTSGSGGLTMAANSQLAVKLFGINPTEISLVTAQGDVTVDTNKISLDLSALTSTQASQLRAAVGVGNTQTYTILTASESLSGTGFNSAGFSVSNFGSFFPGEWSFGTFDRVGDGGITNNGFVTIRFSPVPEPSSILALCTVSLGGIHAFRRYRTKTTGSS